MNLDDLNLDEFDVFSLPHKDLPCDPRNLHDLRCKAAIYFVCNKKNIIYIGQTRDLMMRINAHRYKTFRDKSVSFYYLALSGWYENKYSRARLLLEKLFIEHFRPMMNIVYTPDAPNVKNESYSSWLMLHHITLSYQEIP